ncbi:MAG: FAD-binding oxidoreductase [Jatrophihabitans sp.]|nr:MAG: FAD-binding oxidoreductase [Jatrophihabitans sp.]
MRNGGAPVGTQRFDVLVVGGGISGVSIAYEIARTRSVALIEMEAALAYHTSGRSMATFLETYGSPAIRALTSGSRAAFEHPPDVMDGPLLSPLGMLWLAGAGEADQIRRLYDEVRPVVPDARLVTPAEAVRINPLLRPGYPELGLFEPGATEIDVHALHQGYVRGLRRRGGEVRLSARLVAAERRDGRWQVTDAAGTRYEAQVLVDAAGSWVDEVARAAGATPVGIRPLRRTAFLVAPPAGLPVRGLPLTGTVTSTWYVMPQGDLLACSPAEQTLLEPCDAKPDEVQIARALEEINAATILGARSIRSPWAGLRNFVPDGNPVVGWDPRAEGFFWYAAQGGYGMQIAPALSRTGAALLEGRDVDPDLLARGLEPADLSPAREGMSVSAEH